MPDDSFANFEFPSLNSVPSEMPLEDGLRAQQALTVNPSYRMFFADTTQPRYSRMRFPYRDLVSLLAKEHYGDALVFWCQQNGSLDFYGSDGEWDLTHFTKRLVSPKLVALKVAENAYIAKGMSERLAQLLLELQREGRITIGRTKQDNLEVTVEPDAGEESIDSLPLIYSRPPKPIRPYKRPHRVNWSVHIYMGPKAWPPHRTATLCQEMTAEGTVSLTPPAGGPQ